MRLRRTSGVALALILALASHLSASGVIDPLLRFHQVRTPHFIIYFHDGEDRLAARLAALVEGVRTQVGHALGLEPPLRTHVVLADQAELANGWATPLPRDTVFLNAAAPSGADVIGRTSDWLRLVFTHEYTHIVHLDRSGGWARMVRGVFGRTAVAFPNLWLPQWQIEGLATYEESAITGEGRLHAGDFREIERLPAAMGRPAAIDRANGGLADWPDGHAAYSAGLGFHEFLATRFASVSFGELGDATARSLPFTGSRAFARLYGASLGSLWNDYLRSIDTTAVTIRPPHPVPTRVTHVGSLVSGPRFAPSECDGCRHEIVYSSRNPHEFPSLRSVGVDGRDDRRLATRYLGDTAGLSRRIIVFDQQEIRRNVGVYADLYLLDRRTGQVRGLTRNARMEDPDLAPDGESIVAVRDTNGHREVVVTRLKMPVAGAALALAPAETMLAEADTDFSDPRWSPDGQLVAVERRRLSALPDVVVVDVRSHTILRVVSDHAARIVTPSWRPDGRAVVAAADFDEAPFDLYEFPLEPERGPRRLTWTNGALWPDVSPDGSTLTFAGYTVDGYDVFTQPYPAASDERAVRRLDTPSASGLPATSDEPPVVPALSAEPYSPLGTILPTTWSPVYWSDSAQTRVGATVAGADILGRHAYAADVTWLARGPSVTGTRPQGPDVSATYVYTRWRPSLFVSASRATSFIQQTDASGPTGTSVAVEQRELQGGVLLPFLHVRMQDELLGAIARSDNQYSIPDDPRSARLVEARLGFGHNTAIAFADSISPERGVSIGGTTELSRRAIGSAGDATTATLDARAYLPGAGRHHVVALRVAAGLSRGDDTARQYFTLGGSHASSSTVDFGSDALGLLRGFPAATFYGDKLTVVSTDYRLPLGLIERGHGTLPLFLRTLQAAIFTDAGRVWFGARSDSRWKTSFGGELAASVVAGYSLPVTLATGVAWGRDGSVSRGATFYARLGRAF